MGFKKATKTFLGKAGRLGAPSARKPILTKEDKRESITGGFKTAKKTKRKPIGKAKVVRNGRPLKTGKVKKNVNNKTGKKASNFPLGPLVSNKRFSNFFSGKGPKGKFAKSTTNSPQTAPQSFRPRG